MNISGSNILNNIYRLAARVNRLFSLLPTTSDRIIYVSPRGNDSFDGLSWGTAKLTVSGGVAALGGNPGVIQLGAGVVSTGGTVNLQGRTNVTIRGLGGMSAGGSPVSIVTHSLAGAGAAIDLRNSIGCRLESFMLLYNNAGFTGAAVDLSNSGSTDAVLWSVQDMYIGGGSGVAGGTAINLVNAIVGTIERCNIVGNTVGILGRTVVGDYSNGIKVLSCRFGNNSSRHISNIGEGWSIDNCVFEPLTSGGAGSIVNDAAVIARGNIITGCWFGDVTPGVGGTQIAISGVAHTVTGNFIGIQNGATAVSVAAASTDFIIRGNRIVGGGVGDTGITMGAGCVSYDITGNAYATVATRVGGAVTATANFQPGVDAATTWQWTNVGGGSVMLINSNNGRIGINQANPIVALDVGGNVRRTYRANAGNTAVGVNERVVAVSAAAGASNATLPLSTLYAGLIITIIKSDASVNAVTVNCTGGETINGAATAVLAVQYAAVTVVSNGAGWYIIP